MTPQQQAQNAIKWIDIFERSPEYGQNVIASGTWWGEISGTGDSGYMGIGTYRGGRSVSIDSDTYSTHINQITHWIPLPPHPTN